MTKVVKEPCKSKLGRLRHEVTGERKTFKERCQNSEGNYKNGKINRSEDETRKNVRANKYNG